jgi:HEPN domain-containing protein
VARISYLEFSKDDFKYAQGNFKLGFYNPAGRFCQQSIEKRLKHYIELYGNEQDNLILMSHKLSILYARVCHLSHNEPNPATTKQLNLLTDYYFDLNYPAEHNYQLTKKMAQEALEIAEEVNRWVDGLLEGGH